MCTLALRNYPTKLKHLHRNSIIEYPQELPYQLYHHHRSPRRRRAPLFNFINTLPFARTFFITYQYNQPNWRRDRWKDTIITIPSAHFWWAPPRCVQTPGLKEATEKKNCSKKLSLSPTQCQQETLEAPTPQRGHPRWRSDWPPRGSMLSDSTRSAEATIAQTIDRGVFPAHLIAPSHHVVTVEINVIIAHYGGHRRTGRQRTRGRLQSNSWAVLGGMSGMVYNSKKNPFNRERTINT